MRPHSNTKSAEHTIYPSGQDGVLHSSQPFTFGCGAALHGWVWGFFPLFQLGITVSNNIFNGLVISSGVPCFGGRWKNWFSSEAWEDFGLGFWGLLPYALMVLWCITSSLRAWCRPFSSFLGMRVCSRWFSCKGAEVFLPVSWGPFLRVPIGVAWNLVKLLIKFYAAAIGCGSTCVRRVRR